MIKRTCTDYRTLDKKAKGVQFCNNFDYTPQPLDEFKSKLGYVYKPYNGEVAYRSPMPAKYKAVRRVYSKVLAAATGNYAIDYLKDPSFKKTYIEFLVNKEFKYEKGNKSINDRRAKLSTKLYKKYDNDDIFVKDAHESVITFSKHLVAAYEQLDYDINNQDHDDYSSNDDVSEELFNYQGISPIYTLAGYHKLQYGLLPQHNEQARWLTILNGLQDYILVDMHNPFIQMMYGQDLFIHPTVGKPMAYTLNNTDMTKGISFTNKFVKNNSEAYVRFTDYGFYNPKDGYISITSGKKTIYTDGWDWIYTFQMYVLAKRIQNLGNQTVRSTKSEYLLFAGYQTWRVLEPMRMLAERRVDRARDVIEELSNNGLPDDWAFFEDVDDALKWYEDLIDNISLSLDSIEMLTNYLSMEAESLVSDPNNRNALGSMFLLRSYESGQWNEVKEEQDTGSTLTVNINANKSDYEA